MKIAIIQQADVALVGWNCSAIPAGIVKSPGRLRYVCNVTGEMGGFVPREVIDSDILVSNWGDSPAVVVEHPARIDGERLMLYRWTHQPHSGRAKE